MTRVQTPEYQQKVNALQAVAAPHIQAEQFAADPNASGAYRLASALNVAVPHAEKFTQDYEKRKQQEQEVKLEGYVERFRQDGHTGGAVSQAQVKAVFPEVVPVIAARIAEEMGKSEASKQFGAVIEEIQGDDSLRLDSVKRNAHLEKRRRELTGQIGEGNDFFATGFAQNVNKQLSQYEHQWKTETASYQQKVQGDGFTREITDALNGSGDMKEVDQRWGVSSSLNPLERKKLVTQAAIDTAVASDDPTILDKVPQLFHDTHSKALFAKTKLQIQEHRMSSFRFEQTLKEHQRTEEVRGIKQDVVDTIASGKPLDPRKYMKNPEGFQYAIQMRDTPLIDEAVSGARVSSFKQELLSRATVGASPSAEQLSEKILNSQEINAKDKQALIKEIPKLLEGHHLMKDEVVRQQFNDHLNPLFDMLEKSPETMLAHLKGKSPRTAVMTAFDRDVQRSFQAHYETNKSWPTGFDKKALVDKSIERATAHLEKLSQYTPRTSDTAPLSRLTKPTAPPQLPKGVTKID